MFWLAIKIWCKRDNWCRGSGLWGKNDNSASRLARQKSFVPLQLHSTLQVAPLIYSYQNYLTLPWPCSFKVISKNVILTHPVLNVNFYAIKNIPIQRGMRVCFHQSQLDALSLQQRPVQPPPREKKIKILNGPLLFISCRPWFDVNFKSNIVVAP